MSELTIARVFDTTKEKLMKACTMSEHLSVWWGGGSTVECFDFRPNGKFVYIANGKTYRNMFLYQEISDYKIEFVSGFVDEQHNFIPASFFPTFPLQVKNIWTVDTNEENKAVLTVRRSLYNGTSEEEVFFETVMPSMQSGLFDPTFAALDNYLTTME